METWGEPKSLKKVCSHRDEEERVCKYMRSQSATGILHESKQDVQTSIRFICAVNGVH